MSEKGFLRVYLEDNSWATIPASLSTTAGEVCTTVVKKRKIKDGQYILCMVDSDNDAVLKQLQANDFPLSIQESIREHNQGDNFKFVCRTLSDGGGGGSDSSEGSSEDEGSHLFGRVDQPKNKDGKATYKSYLEKKGARHKAWRKRWFELRGDKMFYYRTRNGKFIAAVELSDAVVRCQDEKEFLFDIVTNNRIFELRANSKNEMRSWIASLKESSGSERENMMMDDIQTWLEHCETVVSNAQLRLRDETKTLQGTLNNARSTQLFLKMLQGQSREEMLEFHLKAEQYVAMKGDVEARGFGDMLYTSFIVSGAPHELPMMEMGFLQKREDIQSTLVDDPERTALTALQERVFATLESSPQYFPQYLNSMHYDFLLQSASKRVSSEMKNFDHFQGNNAMQAVQRLKREFGKHNFNSCDLNSDLSKKEKREGDITSQRENGVGNSKSKFASAPLPSRDAAGGGSGGGGAGAKSVWTKTIFDDDGDGDDEKSSVGGADRDDNVSRPAELKSDMLGLEVDPELEGLDALLAEVDGANSGAQAAGDMF